MSNGEGDPMQLRLCVIRSQEHVLPLVRHEVRYSCFCKSRLWTSSHVHIWSNFCPLAKKDDVETDLFLDPRYAEKEIRLSNIMDWSNSQPTTTHDEEKSTEDIPYYGVGWYGQRPVPSLGGGPGYGAEADEVWSIEEEMLETLAVEGVEIPVIDVGMAHGEKARGGALF